MKLAYSLLYVHDVENTMNFYAAAFGLEKGFLHDSKQYGEMLTGETKLGFVQNQTASSHGFEYQAASPNSKPFPFELGFTTTEVEAAYQKAIKAGATPLSAPTKKPWGQMVSYVRECNGFLVEICSPMSA